MRRALVALTLLLAAAHVAINAVGLPPVLVAENLALAGAYLAAAAALGVRWGRGSLAAYLLLVSFEAGRVSRSVWTPAGLAPLWAQHLPLLAYLLLLAALALLALRR